MIQFKNSKIRVRCLECKTEHFIEMKYIKTEKDQRSIGFEYEHTYSGDLKCLCGENMKILSLIYEYPKGFINYIDSDGESCLIMDDITENSFNISE